MAFNPVDDAARFLAAIVESSDDSIIGTDLDGVILTWNRGATRLYGYTADEMRGQSLAALVPEDRRGEVAAIFARIKSGDRVDHHETVRRTRDGTTLPVWLSVSPITDDRGQVVGVASVARDISKEKQSESALRASDRRWRSVVESAVDGIVVMDARGRIESFNPAAERLFGYAESEVAGRNVSMLMPPPYRDDHDGYLERYLREGTARIIGIGREVQGLRRDGSVFPLHLSVGEIPGEEERRFTGILHDLTERVRLDERLRTSEGRWRAIVESAVDGIVVIDAKGRIEGFNPAAEKLFGYSAAEVLGQNVNLLMPMPYRREHDGYLSRYLTGGDPRIIGIGREVTGCRRDGSTFPFHLSVGEMSDGGERKFTGILHDLSARARMEEQIREQATLARVGEMAAVIAHEVKNPLAGVRGAIQVIGGRLPKDGQDAAIVSEIIARVDALSDLMKDLLMFARPPQPKPAPVDVGHLVRRTAHLLSGDPALREVRIEVEGTSPPMVGDAELLKIVFLNLLVNAAHAMQGHGTIQVSVAVIGGACHIAFTDNGPGIPAEIHDKLFTPFFTTKARGTGLGLPTAKRLIEAHHGTIRINSPPGGGTTVTVQLPVPQ